MKKEVVIALVVGLAVGLIVSLSSARLSNETLSHVQAAADAEQQAANLKFAIDKARQRADNARNQSITNTAVTPESSSPGAEKTLLRELQDAQLELVEIAKSHTDIAVEYL